MVEVLSPGDSQRLMRAKIAEYLNAGVRLAWVIDPARRIATCYRPVADVRVVSEDGHLDGEDVVPGFRCRVAEVLG